jgi:hemin uptake protein HemP
MITVDMVLAITAIMAIVVSTISFLSNVKHNKNSVKSICSIYETNYENFISVRIENDGTGPLIIKSIKCSLKKKTDEGESIEHSSNLLKLLPQEIRQSSFHRVFVDTNKLTIPSNRQKYLLSITLEDEEIRNKLRECLKNITISVEYTDIYNSKFKPLEKKLNFFETNLKLRITDVGKLFLN